jgi:hypothetical protein
MPHAVVPLGLCTNLSLGSEECVRRTHQTKCQRHQRLTNPLGVSMCTTTMDAIHTETARWHFFTFTTTGAHRPHPPPQHTCPQRSGPAPVRYTSNRVVVPDTE